MVRFDSVVKLILVPTRNDLDGLSTDLWWREEDYAQFRYDTYDRIIIVIVNFFVNPSRLLFRLSGQAMVTGVFTPPPVHTCLILIWQRGFAAFPLLVDFRGYLLLAHVLALCGMRTRHIKFFFSFLLEIRFGNPPEFKPRP